MNDVDNLKRIQSRTLAALAALVVASTLAMPFCSGTPNPDDPDTTTTTQETTAP